jgi:hypothetical protein
MRGEEETNKHRDPSRTKITADCSRADPALTLRIHWDQFQSRSNVIYEQTSGVVFQHQAWSPKPVVPKLWDAQLLVKSPKK